VRRAALGLTLAAASLATGITVAALCARNRARGDELDRLERWCEAQSRRNDLARAENQRQEWRLRADLAAEVRVVDTGGAKP
jgi:hypothetical protein